jgi:hypothetical protein
MDCTVRFVDDHQLDLDWVLVKEPSGGFIFIVRRSAMSPRVLAEAWAAYVLATAKPTLLAG